MYKHKALVKIFIKSYFIYYDIFLKLNNKNLIKKCMYQQTLRML